MAVPKLDFDIVKDLEDAGASQELAKAVVRAISEKQTANLATKADLVELRGELKEELSALELRLTEKMAAMHTKVIIWLVGTAIASITLVATIGQLLK